MYEDPPPKKKFNYDRTNLTCLENYAIHHHNILYVYRAAKLDKFYVQHLFGRLD